MSLGANRRRSSTDSAHISLVAGCCEHQIGDLERTPDACEIQERKMLLIPSPSQAPLLSLASSHKTTPDCVSG